MSEPTSTKLEPTLTSLRKLAENHLSFGQYKAAQISLEAIDAIEQLEAENAKLRELIANVHEALCADKAGMFNKLTLASMEDDMREVGIEVDG